MFAILICSCPLEPRPQMWVIDAALTKMNAELSIDLPKVRPSGKGA
jgi:hypothetical protein